MSVNPDCRDGKHRACRGDAWDAEKDAPAECGCACHRLGPTLHPDESEAGWLCISCAIKYTGISRRTLYRRRAEVETRRAKGLIYWKMTDLEHLEQDA